mgnify:CR=1 FL=1
MVSAVPGRIFAGEVEALFRQLVTISNTAIDGRYIFAGVKATGVAVGTAVFAAGNVALPMLLGGALFTIKQITDVVIYARRFAVHGV